MSTQAISVLVVWLCLFPVLLATPERAARAGAWLQPQGRGEIVFSSTMMLSDQRFDRKGRARRADRFLKQESQSHVEYGAFDSLTMIGAIGGRTQMTTLDEGALNMRSTSATGGVRIKLWRDDTFAISLQATGEGRYIRSLGEAHLRIEPHTEVDIRALAGANFEIGTLPGFAEMQFGWRHRGGSFANEARLDATLGIRPLPSVLLLLQSFNSIALSRDHIFGAGRIRQHKVQASAMVSLTQRMRVQFGVFTSVAGRGSLRETGLLMAVGRSF